MMTKKENLAISRAQAIAIFEGLGVKSAGGWKKEKMNDKVRQINLLVPEDTKIGDEDLDKILDQMIGAREMDEDIDVLSDKAYMAKYGAPEGKNGDGEADEAPEEAKEEESAEDAPEEEKAAEKAPEEPKEAKKEKKPKENAEKKPRGENKYSFGFKVRGSESYDAGIAIKALDAADGDGKVTDACWEKFYSIHGSDGKNTRKGFMGAARQAIRAFLGHKSDRENPGKAYQVGAMLKAAPDSSFQDLAAKLSGETPENPIIAKKAIQALCGYGLLELKD